MHHTFIYIIILVYISNNKKRNKTVITENCFLNTKRILHLTNEIKRAKIVVFKSQNITFETKLKKLKAHNY